MAVAELPAKAQRRNGFQTKGTYLLPQDATAKLPRVLVVAVYGGGLLQKAPVGFMNAPLLLVGS
jgi:hypothetical protein